MLKAFDVSIGIFVRGLTNLKALLKKAESHAAAHGTEPGSLLTAQLAGDMYNLAVQVHWAAEGAKLALQRLVGIDATPAAEEGKSFAELYARIDAAVEDLRQFDAATLEAALERSVSLPYRGGKKEYRGDQFLTEFAIPNFFFHLTTAYGILRHHGVPLQKADFMGS